MFPTEAECQGESKGTSSYKLEDSSSSPYCLCSVRIIPKAQHDLTAASHADLSSYHLPRSQPSHCAQWPAWLQARCFLTDHYTYCLLCPDALPMHFPLIVPISGLQTTSSGRPSHNMTSSHPVSLTCLYQTFQSSYKFLKSSCISVWSHAYCLSSSLWMSSFTRHLVGTQ